MKKLTTITAMAFTVISLASITASAQVTPTAGANDLILGFEVTAAGAGSMGASTDLELDLGPASGFTSTAIFNNLGLLGADLSTVYGTNWATRTDLVWSVAGVAATNVYDITSHSQPKETTAYVNNIGAMASTLNSANATPLTGAGAAEIGTTANPANTITGSYTKALTTGSDFGITTLGVGESQDVNTTGPDGTLDLYKFVRATAGTNAALLGDFVLSGSGSSATFAFNPQAAPEPSSYVLVACGMVFLFVVLRRRNKIA